MLKENTKLKNNKKGFTLIELVIVIAVIAIISAIAIPKYGKVQQNAKRNADIANAKVIGDVVTSLIADGSIDETVGPLTLTPVKAQDENSVMTLIREKLQTVPVAKTKVTNTAENGTKTTAAANFVLNINNGAIEINVGGEEVYPNQEGTFAPPTTAASTEPTT